MKSKRTPFVVGTILVLLLFAANLIFGSVVIPFREVLSVLFTGETSNPSWKIIVLESRIPSAVTSMLCGASLAVSGLLMQTLFRNPLAGPSILGVNDGANLGVALVMFLSGGTIASLAGYSAIIAAAIAGASVILAIILFFSEKVSGNVMLLIIGIMVGYIVSSFISILNYFAAADKVRQFVMWGMGNFSSVSMEHLPLMAVILIVVLLCSFLLIKPLNAFLLGERYAANLGINIRRTRMMVVLSSGILAAVVTAYCGPVSFIGMAVPHIARMLTNTADHRILMPMTLIMGGVTALLCNLLTILPGSGTLLPLNAVTPLFGAPVVIYVILKRRNRSDELQ